MTLVCHHPEVASNRSRYFGTDPQWRENGAVIDIANGTIYTEETAGDFTQTFLTITITVNHFRDKSFNYSCLLALGRNGLPTGGVETSGEVTVDPVGELVVHAMCTYVQLSPHLTVINVCRTLIHLQYFILEAVFYYTHARMWVTGP